ncbi:MAG: hypothetical protein GXX85_06230 [Ignavibacteria bacterium]|nr:hypothetical protein [Ignavibacteria bacterium]
MIRKILLAVFITIAAAGTGILIYGHFTEQDFFEKAIKDLDINFAKHNRRIFLKSDVKALPPPVRNYLIKCIKEGQISPGFARFKQIGKIRSSSLPDFVEIEAEGYYSTNPYGYLWRTNVKHSGFIPGNIAEFYFEGNGITQSHMLTGVKFNYLNGGSINNLLLAKYLSNTVLFPSVLLPRKNIKWEEAGKDIARLTVFDYGNSVSVLFHFDKDNLPFKITNDEASGDGNVFVVKLSNYQHNGGFNVPMHFEYEWLMDNNKYLNGIIDVSLLDYNTPKYFP